MNSARPQLPMWIFIATDLALLGAAGVIATQAPRPFSEATILWIVGCVMAGIFLGLVPIIWRFERLKNEALDDRQSALEALARTISSSADQISIATGGLHEIAELAQKNLRHADHLPQRLQEKIAEFQAQIAQANDTDKEELERELLALRTSESERLDSVSQRIAKASVEWAKLESATAHHLTTASETLAKLSLGTASAIGQAQAAAEQALTQARVEAARTVGEASGQALKAMESARTAALSELTTKLTGLTHRLADDFAALVVARIANSTAALGGRRNDAEPAPAPRAVVAPSTTLATPTSVRVEPTESTVSATTAAVAATGPTESASSATQTDGVLSPANPAPSVTPAQPAASVAGEQTQPVPVTKRPRKPRREAPPAATSTEAAAARSDAASDPATDTAAPPSSDSQSAPNAEPPPKPTVEATVRPKDEPAARSTAISPSATVVVAATDANSAAAAAATTSPSTEPTPLPSPGSGPAFVSASGPAAGPAPVSPPSAAEPVAATPETDTQAPSPAASAQPATTSEAPASVPASEEPDIAKVTPGLRKRTARKPAEDDSPALDLGLGDSDFGDTARNGPTERVMTSDGATRLLITAYIGIGNRLFIRGDGPGLSWDKGVPLSFISIGKWRWETNDAVQPISFKLYKNDELECSALGKRTLDPGYQQDVTAAF